MTNYELEQALACKQMEVEDLRQQLTEQAEAIDLQLHINRRVQELEAEKEAFYMDYRTQCDKDTKTLEERIVILSMQLAEKETQRRHLMATYQRQGDSAQEVISQLRQQISQCNIVSKENESLSFTNLCALLPEDTCWGDTLTPSLAREILMAYRSERHKDEQRD